MKSCAGNAEFEMAKFEKIEVAKCCEIYLPVID